jgi:hypothetical protein
VFKCEPTQHRSDYSKTVTFFGGYRYLAVNYDRSGYVFDVALSGPVLGATFRF